jgi:hypothetical protein
MADDFHMRQLRVRQAESKAGFESTQEDLNRSKNQLANLRRENKELRNALQQSAKDIGNQSKKSMTAVETDIAQSRLHQMRRTYDELKATNKDVASEIKRMEETRGDLDKEGKPILHDNSPLAQKIRTLENRLDKSLIKHNEAVAIRRTYETILRRLQEERVSFDNQLAAIEKTLKAKEHDDAELQNMAHDAQHAKEMAKAELEELKKAVELERRQKRKDLEERKTYVSAKLEQAQKQEKLIKDRRRQEEEAAIAKEMPDDADKQKATTSTINELQTEEEARRLQEYADTYRQIKEFTRSSNKDEVLQKWHELDDTTDSLRTRKQAAQSKIEALLAQRAELHRKVEDSKYSGNAQISSRRVVDEFETHLSVAKVALTKAMEECEETTTLHTAVKAGVEHLAQKMSLFRPEVRAPAITSEGADNTVAVMKHCETKLKLMLEELQAEGVAVDGPIAKELEKMDRVDLPEHNLRIRTLPVEHTEEQDDKGRAEDDAEEDPHSREDLKQMAVSAVERETKRAKKRRGKD